MADDLRELALDAAAMHDDPDNDQTPERVLEYALSAVGADGAALMLLRRRGHIESVAAIGADIDAADSLQTKLGEGPCLSAIHDESSVRVDDTATDQRWPTWGPGVAEIGYRSLLCVQLRDNAGVVGALNLYDRERNAFDEDDRAVAYVLARHAGIALRNARHMSELHTAIDARKLIGQAQGILMERYGLDADQAFAVLRRYSQHNNVKLRLVAQRLIDTRQLPKGG